MNNDSLITERSGLFFLNLKPCTCGILKYILDPEIGVVWIRRHIPNAYMEWWQALVVFAPKRSIHEVEVRALQFDLQLSTKRFLELLCEFEGHGIEMLQMTRPIPDTLDLHGVAEEAVSPVLIQNGLHLAFYLPHSNEFAQLRAPSRNTIERLLQIPEIRSLAYPPAS